jgi:polyisoprenoid-binding protein YceI
MVRFLVFAALLSGTVTATAQQAPLSTSTGYVRFFSDAALEDIEAKNTKVAAALDTARHKLAIRMRIAEFSFDNSLMQDHFNENYLESERFPEATFTGTIVNPTAVKYGVPGTYTVQVQGKLTIHGVTRDVTVPATLEVYASGDIRGKTTFMVRVADYGVEVPSMMGSKIAEQVEVSAILLWKHTH